MDKEDMVHICTTEYYSAIKNNNRMRKTRDLFKKIRDTKGTFHAKMALVDKALVSISLIQFSADGWGCVPSLYFGLRPNYSRGNGGNVDLLQKDLCQYALLPELW